MIDLTPLDVRKKKGDFRKSLRGYDPEEVDVFMDLVAERLEGLVKENRALTDRVERAEERLSDREGRERAVHEALVTAQELREEMKGQAQREADFLRKEAETEAKDLVKRAEARAAETVADAEATARETTERAETKARERVRAAEEDARGRTAAAERRLEALARDVEELERKRGRFLRAFRALLEQEMDALESEEARRPPALDGGRIETTGTDRPLAVAREDEAPAAGADDEEAVESAFHRIVEPEDDEGSGRIGAGRRLEPAAPDGGAEAPTEEGPRPAEGGEPPREGEAGAHPPHRGGDLLLHLEGEAGGGPHGGGDPGGGEPPGER